MGWLLKKENLPKLTGNERKIWITVSINKIEFAITNIPQKRVSGGLGLAETIDQSSVQILCSIMVSRQSSFPWCLWLSEKPGQSLRTASDITPTTSIIVLVKQITKVTPVYWGELNSTSVREAVKNLQPFCLSCYPR